MYNDIFEQCISSMQNQQTENKNNSPLLSHKQKNYQILKCKGKPFWLNLSQNKNKNYQKYNILLNPQTSIIADSQSQQIIAANLYPLPPLQKQSCLESVQSFNQNYDEDFQIYKQTIEQQTQQKRSNQSTHNKLVSSKKFDLKLLRLESKILKTQRRKVNLSSLSKINTGKISKIKVQKKIKTQQSSIRSQSVDLQHQIYMNENPKYLQQQNQKMVQIIKQMRNLLPIFYRNHQQITQQRIQISSLKEQVQKATSAIYGFELEKNKSILECNKKHIKQNIKVLNSPKKVLQVPLTFRDNKNNSNIIIKEERVRQQLLCKLRLSTLRQQKSIQLDKKINLYEKIFSRISKQQKINSFSSLQRRKTFLSWDIQRMKNQFDLQILQENLENSSLKEQIQLLQLEIQQKQRNLLSFQQNDQIENNPSLRYKAKYQQKVKKDRIQIQEQSFCKVSQKQRNISHYNLSSKPQVHNKSQSSQKTIFCNKKQKQKLILSLNQKSLPEIRQQKALNTPKLQTSTSRNQKHIRIKRFAFKNANLNEDLEQLIL